CGWRSRTSRPLSPTHPRVRHTCVVAKKNTAGGTYLVGYVIPAGGHKDLSADDVKAWATAAMVEYMVPTHVVVLPEFPLTANGKVDRNALPEPTTDTGALQAPTTENERLVCEAVAAVLRLDAVGTDQDFFQLGGDSILAISLLSALREAGLHVSARQIFTHTVVGALAAVASRESVAAVDHGDVATGTVVGSPIVQWLGETTDAIDGFVQSVVLTAPAELTPGALDGILTAVLTRHDMLRARLVRGERWGFDIPEAGATARCWEQNDAPVEDCVALATAALDPDHGVMLRAVWRRAARQLVLVAHHVVIDGVSWRILMDDLATAWRQHSSGEAVELPPVGTSFRRWTQLLGRTPFDADRTHHAAALPAADAPIGRRALTAADTVARERTRTVSVDPVTTTALLGEIPATFHAGVNDVLLTALAVALARWRRDRGQDQTFAHIELEGHGRESRFVTPAAGFEPELSRTVGWFTTLFPVTVDPGTASDLTAPDYLTAALKAVKEDLARVPAGGLSYGALRYLTGDAPAGDPAPQVLFNYLGRFDAGGTGDWQLAGTTGQLGEKRDPRMRLPRALEFNAIAEPDATGAYELVTTISWPEGVFTEDDITTLGDHFRSALTALAALEDGGHTPSDFPLVPLTQGDVDALDGPALHDILPLTPLQEGLYFHSVFDDDATGSYVEQQVMTLDGDVDADRLAAAATRLLTLYPNLAARFTALTDGRVVSVVENGRRAPFTMLDGPARTDEEIRELAEQDRRAGFDLATGPLTALHPHPLRRGPPGPRPDRAPHHRGRLVGAADAPHPAGRVPHAGLGVRARRLPRLRGVARRPRPGRERPGVARGARRTARALPGRRGPHPLRTVRRRHGGARRGHRRGRPHRRGLPERGRAQRVGGDPGRAAAQQGRRLRLHRLRTRRRRPRHPRHGGPLHQHHSGARPLVRHRHGVRPAGRRQAAPGSGPAAPARLPRPDRAAERHGHPLRHPGRLRRRHRRDRPARPRRHPRHHRHRQRGCTPLPVDARRRARTGRPGPLQPHLRRRTPAPRERRGDPRHVHPDPHRTARAPGHTGRRTAPRAGQGPGTGGPDHPGRAVRRRRAPRPGGHRRHPVRAGRHHPLPHLR
ncbi:peptide synthetase, partial [Streptomyces sp. SID4931]